MDWEYGSVSLRSPQVAEMVHDAVQEMREASSKGTKATGQALLSAVRGLSDAISALMTWCAKHGVEIDTRGDLPGRSPGRRPDDAPRGVRMELRRGLEAWTNAGRDAAKFRAAEVRWREEGRGTRTSRANSIRR